MPMPSPITLSGGSFVEEIYEHPWIIPKWMEVSKRERLLKNSAFIITTDGKESQIQTKWRVEWKLVPYFETGSATKSCQVHWTLIEMEGMDGDCLIAKIKTSVTKNNRDGLSDLDYQSDERQRYFRLNEPVKISFFWISEDVLKPDGNLSVQLKLTLVLPRKCKEYITWEEKQKESEEFERKRLRKAENESDVKVEGSKKKKEKLKQKEICWLDEWNEAEAVGSGNPQGNNTSQAADERGSGTSTSAQARASLNGNGKAGGKRRKNKKSKKRIGKDDIVGNQGRKKIKLESDINLPVKQEVDQDESGEQGNDISGANLESHDNQEEKVVIVKEEVEFEEDDL